MQQRNENMYVGYSTESNSTRHLDEYQREKITMMQQGLGEAETERESRQRKERTEFTDREQCPSQMIVASSR